MTAERCAAVSSEVDRTSTRSTGSSLIGHAPDPARRPSPAGSALPRSPERARSPRRRRGASRRVGGRPPTLRRRVQEDPRTGYRRATTRPRPALLLLLLALLFTMYASSFPGMRNSNEGSHYALGAGDGGWSTRDRRLRAVHALRRLLEAGRALLLRQAAGGLGARAAALCDRPPRQWLRRPQSDTAPRPRHIPPRSGERARPALRGVDVQPVGGPRRNGDCGAGLPHSPGARRRHGPIHLRRRRGRPRVDGLALRHRALRPLGLGSARDDRGLPHGSGVPAGGSARDRVAGRRRRRRGRRRLLERALDGRHRDRPRRRASRPGRSRRRPRPGHDRGIGPHPDRSPGRVSVEGLRLTAADLVPVQGAGPLRLQPRPLRGLLRSADEPLALALPAALGCGRLVPAAPARPRRPVVRGSAQPPRGSPARPGEPPALRPDREVPHPGGRRHP